MKRRNFIQITGAAGAAFCVLTPQTLKAFASGDIPSLENSFINPLKSDSPWAVWHWTSANQTKEGVKSNLEGMDKAGIARATLFSFPPGGGMGGSTFVENPAAPLTPEWFDLMNYAVTEAGHLGIELAIQISAGWSTCGGSWVKPEESQQRVVFTEDTFEGGKRYTGKLARPQMPRMMSPFGGLSEELPEEWSSYYKELSVVAFPIPEDWGKTNITESADVTSSLDVADYQKLTDLDNSENVIKTINAGWIQFSFDQPFTLRTITMNPGSFNMPAHSMEVQGSNDGVTFQKIGNLEPMMNSWQTSVNELTHVVPETKAKYFRLVYDPEPPKAYDEGWCNGTYRGPNRRGFGRQTAEPRYADSVPMLERIDELTISSIELSSTQTVHHISGKTATTWGSSRRITNEEMPASSCIKMSSIIDLTDKLKEDGSIDSWTPPNGKWKIIRFGYTTTGDTNGSGIGQGLEPDKFSHVGATVAFNGWFKRILEHVGPRLAGNVVKSLNFDSWECGSQNWSPIFKNDFEARRGYDAIPYLPIMAGYPLESADITEGFLFDLRRCMADMISENFLGKLKELAHAHGTTITQEAQHPALAADGIYGHKFVDDTAGEFWVNAQNNWKPNDIADAVSGQRIYGKGLAVAEAFTGGGSWKENPYDLKAMGDMHFVDGITKMMLHVWAAQPYPERIPGMTGAAGTYFNENNTWIFNGGKAWFEYMSRCQALLAHSRSVSDALYFIGENIPARALVPPRYGSAFVTEPALPEGYKHDSINQEALVNQTSVKDGMIVLDSGMSYRVLVLRPETLITPQVANKIKELVAAGAQIVGPKPEGSPSLEMSDIASSEVQKVANEVWGNLNGTNYTENMYGKGRVFWGKPMDEVMSTIGINADAIFLNQRETETEIPFEASAFQPNGINATAMGAERQGWGLLWNHHKGDEDYEYYFISNQEQKALSTDISLRVTGKVPELWHADTGRIEDAPVWYEENGRTVIPFDFDPAGSVFVMFRKSSANEDQIVEKSGGNRLKLQVTKAGLEKWAAENGQWTLKTKQGNTINISADNVPSPSVIKGTWDVSFPLLSGSVKKTKLETGSWIDKKDDDIRHFSGTATYEKEIALSESQLDEGKRVFLDLGVVKDVAKVKVNGNELAILWKAPYQVEITEAAIVGMNAVNIEVTNTWYNKLAHDAKLPENQRETWVSGGNVSAGSELIDSGILGPVSIKTEVKI